jgi:hypothetical protein
VRKQTLNIMTQGMLRLKARCNSRRFLGFPSFVTVYVRFRLLAQVQEERYNPRAVGTPDEVVRKSSCVVGQHT